MSHMLLNCKQLRTELNVGKEFVTAMRFCGFPMPGGRATAADALAWLKEHPDFNVTRRTATASPPVSAHPVLSGDGK